MRFRRAAAVVAALLVVATGGVATLAEDPVSFTSADVSLDDRAMLELFATAALVPVVSGDPLSSADSLLDAMIVVHGSATDDGWRLDLSGDPDAADLVAWALMRRSTPFERTGDAWSVLRGPGSLPVPDSSSTAMEVLAHVVERHGTVTGTIFEGSSERADAVADVARTAGLEPTIESAGGRSLVALPSAADRIAISRMPYRCVDRVPVIGGRGCRRSMPDRLASESGEGQIADNLLAEAAWRTGVTGSLIPGSRPDRSAEDGDVGWTNREAQRYVADAVAYSEAGITITTRSRPNPSVDELPFESGLVVSEDTFGLGRLEIDVAVPAGAGLWPAIWLLDAEACDAPGRCPGYATSAYHEIDILETRGQEPDVAYASLHWWDEQLRSTSTASSVPGLSGGALHRVVLERRPGLLRWLIDGNEIAVVAGPVDAEAGPHRARQMRLIMNVAVGGVFAGDLDIGRDGSWWGDARVPAGFPDLGWSETEMVVADVRYEPFGRSEP